MAQATATTTSPDFGRGAEQGQGIQSHTKAQRFCTSASIVIATRTVSLDTVQVDTSTSLNLLPRSIAIELGLAQYPTRMSVISIEERLVQVNQYCRLKIRLAAIDKTINAFVISGLRMVHLGSEWACSVLLLSGFLEYRFKYPIPLAATTMIGEAYNIEDAEVRTRASKAETT